MAAKLKDPTDGAHGRPEREDRGGAVGPIEARAQVERILADATFKSSKRCASFLRHTAARALQGQHDTLKERILGAEVFGRDANYDTSEDPVVRITAGEVRKRLAQYYQEPGHENEIRVDLPAGSYAPQFHSAPAAPAQRRRLWAFRVVGAMVAVAAIATWALWPMDALDWFWGPVVKTPGPVLICVGTPPVFNFTSPLETEMFYGQAREGSAKYFADRQDKIFRMRDLQLYSNRFITLLDAIAMSRIVVLLNDRSKPYHVRGGGGATFSDLRDNATILIGAFSNDWTVKLTEKTRFYFGRDGETGPEGIWDRSHPGDPKWTLLHPWPEWNIQEDYALVTRVYAPDTGRPVIMAAGITQYGTYAAGEFVTNADALREVLRQAPSGWKKQNMQVVLATKIVDRQAAPPRILATHFW